MSKWTMRHCWCGGGCSRWFAIHPNSLPIKWFDGEFSEKNCRSYINEMNEEELKEMDTVTVEIPVPHGDWEKDYEWTGEFRTPVSGEIVIPNDDAKYTFVWNFTTGKGEVKYFRYILRKKKAPTQPKWIPGKVYLDTDGCWNLYTKGGKWATITGRPLNGVGTKITADLVTDEGIWAEIRSPYRTKDDEFAKFIIALLKKTWEDGQK